MQLSTAPNCTFDSSISYVITLEDVKNSVTFSTTTTNQNHCDSGACSTSIVLIQSNAIYNMTMYSQNVFGTSRVFILPISIGNLTYNVQSLHSAILFEAEHCYPFGYFQLAIIFLFHQEEAIIVSCIKMS